MRCLPDHRCWIGRILIEAFSSGQQAGRQTGQSALVALNRRNGKSVKPERFLQMPNHGQSAIR